MARIKENPWITGNMSNDPRAPTHIMVPTFKDAPFEMHPFFSDENGNYSYWAHEDIQADMVGWLQYVLEWDYGEDDKWEVELYDAMMNYDPENTDIFIRVYPIERFVRAWLEDTELDGYWPREWMWQWDDYGPIFGLFASDIEEYPEWAIKLLDEDPEIREITEMRIMEDYSSTEKGEETVERLDLMVSKVASAMKSAVKKHMAEIKAVTGDAARDLADELGYKNVPAMLGAAVDSVLKRMNITKAIGWAKKKTGKLFFTPEEPKILGWREGEK